MRRARWRISCTKRTEMSYLLVLFVSGIDNWTPRRRPRMSLVRILMDCTAHMKNIVCIGTASGMRTFGLEAAS